MVNNAPCVYKAPSVYKSAGGGGGGKIVKDTVKLGGITYKLFFFAGFIFSENLKWPVDLGVNTFAPNGDNNNIAEYGYLYTRPARNALRANINNLGAEWGKWAVLSNSGQIKLISEAYDTYTLNDRIAKFNPQFAGLRRANGNYAAFGSSFCLGYGDTDEYYCDITNVSFKPSLSTANNCAFSLRMVLLSD